MIFKILRENNYLPSMIFYYRKSLFKIVLGQIFFNCQQILKLFAAQFRTNLALNSANKIVCIQLYEKKIFSKYHYQRVESTH